MATKKQISDAVLYKLYGGVPDSGGSVDERDIWAALEQKVNSLFKLHQFDTNLPNGEYIPEQAMIATYEGNTVTSVNEWSTADLPITPISLPKDVGIYLVYDPNYPDMPFIPVRRGQGALLKTDRLLSGLLGQISYEPYVNPSTKKNMVKFNKDLTTLGITEVTMELCVMDISQYGITDQLPIPADYHERIENELVMEFAPVVPESGFVNNFTTTGQNQPIKQ